MNLVAARPELGTAAEHATAAGDGLGDVEKHFADQESPARAARRPKRPALPHPQPPPGVTCHHRHSSLAPRMMITTTPAASTAGVHEKHVVSSID